MKIEEATSNGILELAAANWVLEEKKKENRRIVTSYNAFKRSNDLNDFAHTVTRLHKNATKWQWVSLLYSNERLKKTKADWDIVTLLDRFKSSIIDD